MIRLVQFAPELWTAEGPVVSFYGFRYPTRMAVLRLSGDRLLVWSPTALDDVLKSEMQTLGHVSYLVSPNKLHHLFLADWKKAFPAAALHGPRELIAKRRDLPFEAALTDEPSPWSDEVDQVRFGGSIFLTEFVFFHRLSRTALFCDLIQNFPRDWFTGWRGVVARLDGIVAPRPGAPRDWRASFIRRAPAKRALARVLAWQAQHVVIAHGDMPGDGAAAFIRDAFRWLNPVRPA
jgi:hypothetical protein